MDPNRYDEEFIKNLKEFTITVIVAIFVTYKLIRYYLKKRSKIATPE